MSELVAGEISRKIRDATGLLSTTREILEWFWNELKSKTFLENQYRTSNFLHSIVFCLKNTIPIKTIFEKIRWVVNALKLWIVGCHYQGCCTLWTKSSPFGNLVPKDYYRFMPHRFCYNKKKTYVKPQNLICSFIDHQQKPDLGNIWN